MGDGVAAALAGGRKWAVARGDCLEVLRGLAGGSVQLTVTSPPYEAARTYGVGFKLAGQAWVDWLAERVLECCRVTEGLVVLNAAGQVRRHSYSPVVEWLVADLTRKHGVVCGPACYCYFRFGIPGSGGDHFHRRDWEPCYAFCRPECLPLKWSANTAEGHPPKWAPGGEMANRLTDGTRVNQWGGTARTARHGRAADGRKLAYDTPSHDRASRAERGDRTAGLFGEADDAPATPRDADGNTKRTARTQHGPDGSVVATGGRFQAPALANPGNVVRQTYDAEEVRRLFEDAVAGRIDQGDVLRALAGGGHMGSRLAHGNEAPMSERLAEFFVRSYCPPGGVVLDPFAGSGTTGAVAVRHGRRFVGCDVRQSQVDLACRRLAGETAPLFPDGP